MEKYDLAILGGGPAGLTAAIYAARYNMNFIVITENFGGAITGALEVENWPGKISSGTEITQKMKEQAESFGTNFLQSNIKEIKKENKDFIIEMANETIKAKSIIYALGTQHRHMNIPMEKELIGKGVSYCATCDGMFFKNKTVAVIGGANAAAEGALYLADIAEKVYVIYRREKLRCEPGTLKQIETKDNIEVIYSSIPKKVLGENLVEGLEIIKNDENKNIKVNGIFVEIGAEPNTNLLKNLKINLENEYIVTNKETETNIEGFFAAGDVTNNSFKQMVVATGEGAIAVASAFNYIRFKY